ncbi:MAG: alginate export family protein, partial [Myxococcales bacterium]|nr:alginate export family protein [Myxococcales bacterium]
HQGYLELGRKRSQRGGFVRVGRQEIQVGSRRLIADRNWHPVGQSFDALRLYGAIGRFGADVGVMVLGHARAFTIDDPSGDPDLATPVASPGSYAGYVELFAHLSRAIKLEALAIGLFERPTPWAPTTERNIINAGMRFFGEPLPGLTYDVESYAQGGTNLGLRHRAWALLSDVGYTFKHPLRPGGHLRYHHASGQACTGTPEEGCGNTSSTEFHRLFGLRHAFYGIVDRVAHSNLREVEVATKIRPHESVKLNLSYHFLQLDEPTGLWQNAPDQQVGRGWDPTNTDRNLGHEIDFIVNYRPYEPLMVQPGYGVFFPLEAARRLTGPAPQHFIYLWLIANF